MQPVQMASNGGATGEGGSVVLGGLAGGETVVVEGRFQLEGGARVAFDAAPARP